MSYRDADTAFAARVEALEAENAELRSQLETIERDNEAALKKAPTPNRAVARLEEQREREVVNLRAENELLRSQIDKLEQKIRTAKSEKPPPPPEPPNNDEELGTLRKENTRLQHALNNARREGEKAREELSALLLKQAEPPPPVTDNRDAVIGRLREEIDELREELHRLRGE